MSDLYHLFSPGHARVVGMDDREMHLQDWEGKKFSLPRSEFERDYTLIDEARENQQWRIDSEVKEAKRRAERIAARDIRNFDGGGAPINVFVTALNADTGIVVQVPGTAAGLLAWMVATGERFRISPPGEGHPDLVTMFPEDDYE